MRGDFDEDEFEQDIEPDIEPDINTRKDLVIVTDKPISVNNERTEMDPGWRSLLGGLADQLPRKRTGCIVCDETKHQMIVLLGIGDVCDDCDRNLHAHYLLDSVEMRVATVVMAALDKHRFRLDELFPEDAEAIDTHLRCWLECVKENAR